MDDKGIIWSEQGEIDKVLPRAVKRFEEKFGVRAGQVRVHTSKLQAPTVMGGVRVVPVRYVLKNDYFVTAG